MPHEPLLVTLSQIGAVFAGFMAIFIALVQRDGRMDRVAALRARSILYASVITIFGSLLPLVLFAVGLSEMMSWKLSAAVTVIVGVGLAIEGAGHQLALTPEQKRATGLIFNIVSWGLPAISTGLAICVATGLIGTGNYLAGITIMLTLAAVNFVKISLEQWL